MAARSRAPLFLGVFGVAGASYYLYQAGGDPKVAEKKLEHDAARLSSKAKGELPGKGKELKTEAKVYGEQAGAKIDSAFADAKAKTNELDAKLDSYRSEAEKNLTKYKSEAGKEINSAVDKFDQSVERGAAKVQEEAAKAKSGISSWFGGK